MKNKCGRTGKDKFPNWRAANLSAKILGALKGRKGLRAYKCEYCNSWHIGRTAKAKRKARNNG